MSSEKPIGVRIEQLLSDRTALKPSDLLNLVVRLEDLFEVFAEAKCTTSYDEGYSGGHDDGHSEGYDEGYCEGLEIGQEYP